MILKIIKSPYLNTMVLGRSTAFADKALSLAMHTQVRVTGVTGELKGRYLEAQRCVSLI